MKYFLKSVVIILILFGCNNEPKQPGTTAVDTTVIKRTPPPFQIVVEREQRTQARALAISVIDSIRFTSKFDSLIYTSETKTGSTTYTYKVPRVEVRYKGTIITPPVPPVPPTGASKYLALTNIRTTELVATSNSVIENIDFRSVPGNAIRLTDVSNVEIKNCYFNRSGEEAIEIERSKNIYIHDNLFRYVTTGVYALSSQTIKVINNEFVNVRQRSSGGRGQFVQFNGVSGAGNQVNDNRGENFTGESDPEDMVSMFGSSGTATSPIEIKRNTFRGGGPSTSGGGIILGDYGGSWQVAENNKLLDPGQYGMAIAGGNNCSILNNQIAAKQQSFTNNPLYMWAQQGAACGTNTVRGNKIFWIDKNGAFNGGWDAGNCSGSSFEYPARWNSYAEAVSVLAIPAHFLKFVNAAELLSIRK